MLREALAQLGLVSFVKTTGGKGLHVVSPIERRSDWPEVKSFCKAITDVCVSAAPAQFTSNMSKAARRGRIFIDYLRNERGASAVAPYSTRAREGAPVATPLAHPAELKSISQTARSVDRSNMPALERFSARDGTQLAYRHYPARGQATGRVAILVHGSSGSSAAAHAWSGEFRCPHCGAPCQHDSLYS